MRKRLFGVLASAMIAGAALVSTAGTANAVPPCGLSNYTGTGGGWQIYNCSIYRLNYRIKYYAGEKDECFAGKEYRYYGPHWNIQSAKSTGSC